MEISAFAKTSEKKVEKLTKEIAEFENFISLLSKDNDWIASESNFFGQPNSDFDFSNFDYEKKQEDINILLEENKHLKRKINMKVDVLCDQYEKEYNDLMEKKKIITKDKENIERVIIDLDNKRQDALEEIYVEVNKNLGNIFSSLLPNTTAKVDLLPGKTLMDGLELKVAFHKTWKTSLSELSGGQRSLLALSLILALLLFKPAPLYILDEIDAALDLSHTQNLGIMIKDYFPQSQFLVVSLKDGMFNNANVLFKVAFMEGSSRVEKVTKEIKIKI